MEYCLPCLNLPVITTASYIVLGGGVDVKHTGGLGGGGEMENTMFSQTRRTLSRGEHWRLYKERRVEQSWVMFVCLLHSHKERRCVW